MSPAASLSSNTTHATSGATALATIIEVEPIEIEMTAEAQDESSADWEPVERRVAEPQTPPTRERRHTTPRPEQTTQQAIASAVVRRPRTAATAPVAEPARPERNARVVEPSTPTVSRADRRLEKMGRALNLRQGETITLAINGRSGMARATLIITRYRAALVWRARGVRPRWIPLEEVQDITTSWRGAPTMRVEATVELLSFSHRSPQAMAEAVELLHAEVRQARMAGGLRHDASLTQEWCDRAAQTWDETFGRIRLWIRRHPVFTITWLFTVGMVGYLASSQGLR